MKRERNGSEMKAGNVGKEQVIVRFVHKFRGYIDVKCATPLETIGDVTSIRLKSVLVSLLAWVEAASHLFLVFCPCYFLFIFFHF